MGGIDDILAANEAYVDNFQHERLVGRAAKGLAILTCMDCRIDPLALGGLSLGDVKVVRNAGAQLDGTSTHDLVLASHLLDVNRILILPHTRCAMTTATDAQIRAVIEMSSGVKASDLEIRTINDQNQTLIDSVRELRSNPHLKEGCSVHGGIYDVDTGRIKIIDA
ncbi:MAG TPA: carbonic anhydrase [Candidatus Thalassarchaeaceae archaeon]|nr:MAG TPA: carbonic anhydrase [Candidatus Poseidoniales archaeon]HIH84611.1 carbonic anhydrase [Candidatus Thalassarchaeaceae archaeon]|tara:strand:- start:255 stop:752 length:498 start_codon:yes stop_codon:yes gene_type:complete